MTHCSTPFYTVVFLQQLTSREITCPWVRFMLHARNTSVSAGILSIWLSDTIWTCQWKSVFLYYCEEDAQCVFCNVLTQYWTNYKYSFWSFRPRKIWQHRITGVQASTKAAQYGVIWCCLWSSLCHVIGCEEILWPCSIDTFIESRLLIWHCVKYRCVEQL